MKLIRPTTVTNAMIAACNVPETDYSAYDPGTTYALGEKRIYNHKIYESLQAGNLGNDPATATLWWLDSGYDNRWKMFDQVVSSKTQNYGSITLTLWPGGIDTLALLDIEGTAVTVTMVNDGATVYESTTVLISVAPIVDAWTYFFEPFDFAKTVVLEDLVPYYTASLSVEIVNPGSYARIGSLVIGKSKELGGTQYEPQISITDYSKKTTDDFGNITVTQRAYSKRLACNLELDNSMIDDVQNILAAYRSTPVVWIAADGGYSALTLFGFYKSFSITIAGPNHSTCALDIEGLV